MGWIYEMKKDIKNYNDRGQLHGYNEWYSFNGELIGRENRKNGLRINYTEWHGTNKTIYYIR